MNEILKFDPIGFRGITAIGDVHGNIEGFRKATRRALRKKHFIVALGDLLDYGMDSISVMSDMGSLLVKDRGISLRGNHENKFQKYITQSADNDIRIKIKGGIVQTLAELDALGPEKRKSSLDMMAWVIGQCPLIFQSLNLTAVHAGIEPRFWQSRKVTKTVRDTALYGELKREQGKFPQRIYDWVEKIPSNEIVVVGHTIRDQNEPMIDINDQGGIAIFLDGGSSKGGQLWSMDFILDQDHFNVGSWKMN